MDKRAINKFAVQARRDLVDGVTRKLNQLGITAQGAADKEDRSTSAAEYYVGNAQPLEGRDISRRAALVQRLHEMSAKNDWATAYQDLIEEVAYTWFNRIIAIRFMEVNDYLPSRTRVLSSLENLNEPDIMRDALDLEDVLGQYTAEELALIRKAQGQQQPNDLDAMYRMLFLKQVNKLNETLPKLFEKTDDFMTLLFTPSYNRGVIANLVAGIPEADFDIASDDSKGQVDVIGWLYQYYNQEPHHEVVDINGGPVKERDIPAATQLFTTDWVVRYMVDNSLGRYYLEHTPASKIADQLQYLLPGELHQSSKTLDLSKLRVLDNAMGSGHILVYAFDVLMAIYEEQGYSRREAADQIATHNLYGLEIDKRAYQLAYFAVMMKVRQYDRRAFDRELCLNLFVFEDSKSLSEEFLNHLALSEEDLEAITEIRDAFKDAKTLGSIIHFEHNFDTDHLLESLWKIEPDSLFLSEPDLAHLSRLVQVTAVLQAKYDVVVTNPPYLNKMDTTLKAYVKKYYKDFSGDLFSVFIWLNSTMTVRGGYSAYMTPFVWMFIKTYEALRTRILDTVSISSLIQMEYSAFEEATVPIDTFVLKNSHDQVGSYVKLSAFKGGMEVQRQKVLEAINNPDCKYLYRANQANFEKVPGCPVAYWLPEHLIHLFESLPKISILADFRIGLITGDSERFVRLWHEVPNHKIGVGITSNQEAIASNKKWFPYQKGGKFRRWGGNGQYLVNWEKDGYLMKNDNFVGTRLKSHNFNGQFAFKKGITWTKITSGKPAFRYSPAGFMFDDAGPMGWPKQQLSLEYLLAFLNSVVSEFLLNLLNPTLNILPGSIESLPLTVKNVEKVEILASTNVKISNKDWDAFEVSWTFQMPLLLLHIAEHNRNWTVEEAYNQWAQEAADRFNQLKANEEELNRIFIDLYGLQDELTPEVADRDVSVRKADLPRDIKAFLSYFIGVVFGRYSLDVPGLAFAGGAWDDSKYQTFKPNTDDLILLTDEDYFGDQRDIINRLKQFLTNTFGTEHLNENLRFIADALDKKGDTSEEQIRRYFLDDFYKKDHLSTYQKRPIYWQLSSGRQGGFRALMYLHRYDENTLAMVRTSYLHPLQEAYGNRRTQLKTMIEVEANTKQRNAMTKEVAKLDKQLDEITKYDISLQHVANMHIKLDLDDGVLVNHEKVQGGQKLLDPLK